MPNYKDIIYNLSVEQKISLLTDLRCLADPQYNQYGIPCTHISSVWDILRDAGEGLSPNILARSWNPQLAENVTKDILSSAKDQGVNFVITPSPKVKFDIYEAAVSEDPALSVSFARAYLNAVHGVGMTSAVDGFWLQSGDLDRMDENTNRRILWEYFIQPFQQTVKENNKTALMTSVRSAGGNYAKENLGFIRKAKKEIFDGAAVVICEEETSQETALAIREGAIVLKGIAVALENAYNKYVQLRASVERGEASVLDLDEAYKDGSAISEAMIDEAVDRVISFAFLCQGDGLNKSDDTASNDEISQEAEAQVDAVEKDEAVEAKEESAQLTEESTESVDLDNLNKALRESVVLLKNSNDILPLKNNPTVAIIGEWALDSNNGEFFDAMRETLGDRFFGAAKGYSLSVERCEDLCVEAVKLAARADIVLVFLGLIPQSTERGAKAKTLSLPSNQVELLDALNLYRQKVIGVLVGDIPVDMRFDRYVEALLLAPLGGKLSAQALTDVVLGKFSPCGRLTESYYDDPEGTLEKLKYYKKSGRNKVGAFFGYRQYDSIDQKIRYPFGYGLSYTSFDYSNLKIKDGKITFRIKNEGRIRAAEVVQVYISKPDSAFVRPKKELRAFVKVELDPHQKQDVEIDNLDLSIYDDRKKRRVVERGDYYIYIGNSVQDIKLNEKIYIKGERVRKSKEKRSDYLQTESNIVADKFIVEDSQKGFKKFMFRKVFGIILMIISLGAYALISQLQHNVVLGVLIGSFLVMLALFFLISGIVKSKKAERINEIRIRQMKERFARAEKASSAALEELFVKEFDVTERGQRTNQEKVKIDEVLYMEHKINIETMAKQMSTFFLEKGVEMESVGAAGIISAFASSRLIFVNSEYNGESLNSYFEVLSEYFGSPLYAEEITDRHSSDNGLLFVKDYREIEGETQVMSAINHACDFRQNIHIVVLNKVTVKQLPDLLAPYIRYFNNPMRENSIYVRDTENQYVIPENLWFVVELEKGATLEDVPPFLTEIASVLKVAYYKRDEVADNISEYENIGYYDFNTLVEKSKNNFEIEEDVWKKIDSLESYVSGYTNYHIGNKLALQIEKYFAIFNAACDEDNKALNYVLANKLLPTIVSVLKGQIGDEEKGLFDMMEQLFGEETSTACLEILKGEPSQNV